MRKDISNTDKEYQKLLELNINAIIIYRGDKIIFANKACEEITKYSIPELIGMNFWELAAHEEKVKDLGYRRQNKEYVPSKYQEIIKQKEGGEVWVEFSAKLISWHGELSVMGSFYDLTEHKNIESKLLDSEQRYKALADITNEAIFFSHNGIGIDCNKTAEQMFSYSREEIIGMNGTNIVPEDYKELIIKNMMSELSEPYEAMGQRKDGSIFPIEIQGLQIIYQKKPTRVTIVRDISKQKHDEHKLRQSEQKYKTLTETLTDCVYMIDSKGIFTYLSPAFERITGYDVSMFLGKHFSEGIAPQYRQVVTEVIEKSKFLKSSQVYEVEVISKERGYIPTEISGNSLLSEKGEFLGRIGIFRDITELTRNRQELIIAKEQAIESDKLKTAFLQNMSHEIRTPLNSILGFSDLLKESDNLVDVHQYSTIISNSGRNLLRLINNILDISKIESGSVELNMETFSLNHLLLNIENMIKLNAKEKGIELKMDFALEDEESYIVSDKGKINQILINLINNAIKFTEEGSVTCKYKCIDNMLQFSVSDTGKGIDNAHQEYIFQRFFQSKYKHSIEEGTGLGLAITKGLVVLLGGDISLKSEIDKGSCFTFSIPLNKTNVALKQKLAKKEELSASKLNILIAEDDDNSFLYLEAILRNFNTKIHRVDGGYKAVEFMENNLVDIILMDINMNGMNGLEATKIIKEINPEIPIIIQSAYAFSNERQDALDAGCDAFISKPITKKDLINQINILLK